MKKINPDLMLIMVALIWGTGFIATEYAIDSRLSPIMIMAGRFMVAALVLLMILFRKLKTIERNEWIHGSIAGILLFFGFYFQTYGQSMTTIANSAFLTATNVVFVPFIAWLITKVRPKTKVFFLALLTFIGVAILTVKPAGGISVNKGDVYVLICAVLFATHISYLTVAVKESNPIIITFIQMLVAAILATVGVLIMGPGNMEVVDYSMAIPSILFLGLFSTCLCFFMQTSAQKRTAPAKAAIILSTESLFGTIFSIILGIDPLTAKIVIGGLIIMTAVILTEVDVNFLKSKVQRAS